MARAATPTSFASILDKPASEIERPKPLPQGTYATTIVGLPKFDKSTKKGTEYVEFTHKIMAAGDDVDADELEAMGGIADKTMKNTYYTTETAAWRLKKFLEDCGIDMEEDGMTMRKAVEQTPGLAVNIFVRHEPSQDGTTTFAKIGDTSPSE